MRTKSTIALQTRSAGALTEPESYLNCDLWKMVLKDLQSGTSERAAAQKFGVSRKWIQLRRRHHGIKLAGRKGSRLILTAEEEKLIGDTVLLRQELGVPLTCGQLKTVVQALLVDAIKADPTRTTGWEPRHQMSHKNWVFRFMKRHKLSLRAKAPIKQGRETLTAEKVLMRTKLLKCSSFSPHFIQKASFPPNMRYHGTW